MFWQFSMLCGQLFPQDSFMIYETILDPAEVVGQSLVASAATGFGRIVRRGEAEETFIGRLERVLEECVVAAGRRKPESSSPRWPGSKNFAVAYPLLAACRA
jgi:hypothetical protein